MNESALLALIGDLYSQVAGLNHAVAERDATLAERDATIAGLIAERDASGEDAPGS